MERKQLPNGLKKFIRKEKSRIRRQVSDLKEQQKLIGELYQKTAIEELKTEEKMKK